MGKSFKTIEETMRQQLIKENFKTLSVFAYKEGLSLKLQKLGDRVLFVNSRIERSIEIHLVNDLLDEVGYIDIFKTAKIHFKLRKWFEGMPYNAKLALFEKNGNKPKYNMSEIREINKYRVWFSHPLEYKAELKKLNKDSNEYLKVQQLLIEGMIKYDYQISRTLKELKKERAEMKAKKKIASK